VTLSGKSRPRVLFGPEALRVARHVDKLRYHKGAVPRPDFLFRTEEPVE